LLHILLLIFVVFWNIFWFIGLPLMIMSYLGRWPLLGMTFKKAGEYAYAVILNKENYIFLIILVVASSISNYITTGDSKGLGDVIIDIDTYRWSFSYYIFVISTIVGCVLGVYFVYRFQLFLSFFLPFTLFNTGNPLVNFNNLFLWYMSYLILSIAAIIVGYNIKTYFTGPRSIKLRDYFNRNPKLLPLELVIVNLYVYVVLATLFFNKFSDKLTDTKGSLIDYKYLFVISILIASYMIYVKYRYQNDALPKYPHDTNIIGDGPFF